MDAKQQQTLQEIRLLREKYGNRIAYMALVQATADVVKVGRQGALQGQEKAEG